MGKIILCTGNITEEAFLFSRTNTKIYSIEELCYYIYNNIYILSENDFTMEMADWVGSNLLMPVTSLKLKKMIRKKESLKDIAVTILCSADYYMEDDIKKLIRIMDKLENSSSLERMKLRADNFLKNKDYKNSATVYNCILEESKKESCQDIFLGNILHNLGIITMHTNSYIEAAENFQNAYEKNSNNESLLAFLLCIKLAKKDLIYLKEGTFYNKNAEDINCLLEKIERTMEEAKSIETYQKLENLKNSEGSKQDDYFKELGLLITQWKDEYKNGLI